MSTITVGIDLAKNIFAVHGVDDNGKAALVKPKVSREHLLPLIAHRPPCVIGLEACSGAHHWARPIRQHGHTVRLMAPKFVTPYRMSGKRGKTDAADAAAICEAVTRPNMRFVPVKEEHQQVILALHRTRQGFVEERTATDIGMEMNRRVDDPAGECSARSLCVFSVGSGKASLPTLKKASFDVAASSVRYAGLRPHLTQSGSNPLKPNRKNDHAHLRIWGSPCSWRSGNAFFAATQGERP